MLRKALIGSILLSPLSVYAAVPTAVSDELATAKTDAVAVAALVIAIVVAIAAFKYMKRAM